MIDRKSLEICREFGVKRCKIDNDEIEFFEPKAPQPTPIDPKELVKALGESMPPDSAMLFASSEELQGVDMPNPEPENPNE